MNFRGKKIDSTVGKAGLAFAAGSLLLAACASEHLKPGPIAGNTVYLEKARGYAFCEFEVVQGLPPNLRVQIYNTTLQEECTPAKFEPIDARTLAQKLGADAVVKNPTRYWMMDRLWSLDAGETRNFDGLKATWMGTLELKGAKLGEHNKPFPVYTPSVIERRSKYEWLKGLQVYLLRSPDGKVWVMQAYTNLVEKTLTLAELPKLGSKLKLPPGWKFEVKTLDSDLTLAPPANTGYLAHAVADEFQNIYAGCGFDTACNYIP